MDAQRRTLLLRALAVAGFAFTCGVVFAAYLRPDMLLNFANLILCY